MGLPMKLAEMRGENEVDSDVEERNGLTQDRLRMKKNISANGTYTLTKVAQNSKDNTNTNNGQPEGKEEVKTRSNSVGKALTVDKMKKSNLTASNPIIGAPLANQIAKKTDKIIAPVHIKSKDAAGTMKTTTNATLSKPALANSKIPKYIKKTLKFAKGVDGSDSPGRNSNAEQ